MLAALAVSDAYYNTLGQFLFLKNNKKKNVLKRQALHPSVLSNHHYTGGVAVLRRSV